MTSKIEDIERQKLRISDAFDRSLKLAPGTSSLRGWGQFLDIAEPQVGLYGTCAAFLVKRTIARAEIPPEASQVLLRYWSLYGSNEDKYFVQTPRLAFFVLCLNEAGPQTNPQLRLVYGQAVERLIERQREDGSWSDAASTDFPRLETTALAVFALHRSRHRQAEAAAIRGAGYIYERILSRMDDPTPIDLFVLSMPLHVLSRNRISRDVLNVAIKRALTDSLTNDTQIYYLDYHPWERDPTAGIKRDYLCLPRFVGLCALVTSPALAGASFGNLRRTLAYNRVSGHIAELVKTAPISTAPSGYKSTVDQAFLAISAAQMLDFEPRYVQLINLIMPVANFIRSSILIRAVLPILTVVVFATVAQDPKNLSALPNYLWSDGGTLARLVEAYGPIIQMLSIAFGFLASNPLLANAIAFLKGRLYLT